MSIVKMNEERKKQFETKKKFIQPVLPPTQDFGPKDDVEEEAPKSIRIEIKPKVEKRASNAMRR
jgi:hypothetical protein